MRRPINQTRLRVIAHIVLNCCIATACKQRQGESPGSLLKHDLGQPVQQGERLSWHASTWAEFVKFGSPGQFNIDLALNDEEPIVKRLQYWVDQMYDKTITHPALREAVPKPIVKVVADKTYTNALTVPISVCASAKFNIPVDSEASHTTANTAVTLNSSGIAWATSFSQPYTSRCTTLTPPPAADELVRWYNGFRLPCQLQLNSDASINPSSSCHVMPLPVATQIYALEPTSRYILLSVPMIRLMNDEHKLVAVVAHELGHYFRDHVFFSGRPELRYHYFYEENGGPRPAHRPAAVTDNAALVAEMQRVMDAPPGIPGARTGARVLRDLEGNFVYSIQRTCTAQGAACAASCKSYLTERNSEAIDAVQKAAFGGTALDAAARQAFQKLEDDLYACSGTLELTDDPAVTTKLRRTILPNLLKRQMFANWPRLPAGAATLLEQLNVLNAFDWQNTRDLKSFYDLMATRHLGFYTLEQEADELSLEILANIGIPPEWAEQAVFELTLDDNQTPELFMQRNSMSYSECKTRRDQHWGPDASGSYAFVPTGSLTDPHHSHCYRSYNIYREMIAHQFQVAAISHPEPELSWAEMVAAAVAENKRLTEQAPAQ